MLKEKVIMEEDDEEPVLAGDTEDLMDLVEVAKSAAAEHVHGSR